MEDMHGQRVQFVGFENQAKRPLGQSRGRLIGKHARNTKSCLGGIDGGFGRIDDQSRLDPDALRLPSGKAPALGAGEIAEADAIMRLKVPRICWRPAPLEICRTSASHIADRADSRPALRNPRDCRCGCRYRAPPPRDRPTRSTRSIRAVTLGLAVRNAITMGSTCSLPNTTGAVSASSPCGSACSPPSLRSAASSSSSTRRMRRDSSGRVR